MNLIVGNQNDRDISEIPNLPDSFEGLHLLFLSKCGSGLIENQHPSPKVNGARNRQGLPLAARQGADVLPGIGDLDSNFCHFCSGNLVHFLHLQQAERANTPDHFPTQEKVTSDRCQCIQGKVLIDGSDSYPAGISRRAKIDSLTFHQDFAPCGRVHTGQNLDQCRFTGAVVAQKRMDLTCLYIERYTV